MNKFHKNYALRRAVLFTALMLAGAALVSAALADAFLPQSDSRATEYASQPAQDPVSALNRRIENGEAELKFDGAPGYLRSVLEGLHIPVESQIAVFSKTSVQAGRINPQNPRVLFFNDSAVVGWVPGGYIELAADDPQRGVIFYEMEQRQTNPPKFVRQDSCLLCHETADAAGAPGMIVRSQYTDAQGNVLRQLGFFDSDHRSPLDERWGGWYVTGKSGPIRHMGNAVVADPNKPQSTTAQTLNLDSLAEKFDTSAYLSPYSDIVALMVFEHQMHMMNLFTRISWQVREGQYSHDLNNEKALAETANELVDYMLFVDEPRLLAKISGTSGFAEKFSSEGPRDALGRSLRQLDLQQRLMKFPCSYMIYSDAFDGLPAEARGVIYKRMWHLLSGQEKGGKYARLSLDDRRSVVEILRETKRGLPSYFQAVIR